MCVCVCVSLLLTFNEIICITNGNDEIINNQSFIYIYIYIIFAFNHNRWLSYWIFILDEYDVIYVFVDWSIINNIERGKKRIIIQYVKTNINCQIEQYVRKRDVLINFCSQMIAYIGYRPWSISVSTIYSAQRAQSFYPHIYSTRRRKELNQLYIMS